MLTKYAVAFTKLLATNGPDYTHLQCYVTETSKQINIKAIQFLLLERTKVDLRSLKASSSIASYCNLLNSCCNISLWTRLVDLPPPDPHCHSQNYIPRASKDKSKVCEFSFTYFVSFICLAEQ